MKMRNYVYAAAALLSAAACSPKQIVPEVKPKDQFSMITEHVEFVADVQGDDTKVDFEYITGNGDSKKNGLYTFWDGNEQMDVYIKSGSEGSYRYEYAGRIPAVAGSLSDNRLLLSFSGEVKGRENPETDVFVMVYTNCGAEYDWTKQTLDMSESSAGTNGLKALKNYSPIVWEYDAENATYSNMSNKACYIRFTASGLGANAKVKSLSIFSPDAVFPKTFDLSKFEYQSDNKSKTLSYAFENLSADADGKVEVFLAAPIIDSGEKNYQIHVVTEDGAHTISTLSTNGITSASAMSASKVYNLKRSSFQGATNPAATVGQTQGGSTGAGDVVIESIVGQWDKTGYLSNDIYGVLDMGKPENLNFDHLKAINAINKIYNAYFSGNTDTKIHRAAVAVAGKQGQAEGTGHQMSENGPQYVTSIDDTGTFNNIVTTKPTMVYMTFIDSKAWNTNTIGYYCYNGENDSKGIAYSSAEGHKEVHDLIVFPSTSQSTKGEHLIHKFEAKTTAQLLYPSSLGTFSKEFPAGTTIGLMERVNALEDSKDFALKAISNDSPVHYTNIAWNKLNTLSFCDYWNQIAVLKFKMPEDTGDFNRHGLIYAMKDKYAAHGSDNKAANWTNPIILIYTSEPDAIDFDRSKDYWTETVFISDSDVTYKLSYNLESVTSTKGNSTITLDAGSFTNDKYSTTLQVANPEFGEFSTLKVMIGDRDFTQDVVKNNSGAQAQIEIPKSYICGDVLITAHASRKVMVQSLTANDLNTLGQQTDSGDLPRFRLILHSTSGSGNVAFGLDNNGNSYCLPQAQSPIYNANSKHVFSSATEVQVLDQYNDYEWSIESAQLDEQHKGFKLKKVTKYTDTDVRTDGFIYRGDIYWGSYRYVSLSPTEGTVLHAEQVGDGYQMRLMSYDTDYQYMTCAFGNNLKNAVFSTSTNPNHVSGYGTWYVYKVWLSDNAR